MSEFNYKKIVLAFSGGLDTTTALHYFASTYPETEIIAYCAKRSYLRTSLRSKYLVQS